MDQSNIVNQQPLQSMQARLTFLHLHFKVHRPDLHKKCSTSPRVQSRASLLKGSARCSTRSVSVSRYSTRSVSVSRNKAVVWQSQCKKTQVNVSGINMHINIDL